MTGIAAPSLQWKSVPLGSLITLEYGKGLPLAARRPGPYAVYGSNGIIDRANRFLVADSTIVVGRKGSAGEITLAEPRSWPIDTTYYVCIANRALSSLEYLYYLLLSLDLRRLVDTTTKPGLNRDRVYQQVVSLPPLPVQERIVAILEKADEIRRKRQEALQIADQILPALFIEMFGDPATNPKGYRVQTLAECAHIRRGLSKRPTPSGSVPIVRIKNLTLQGLDLSWHENVNLTPRELKRGQLEEGDIVFSPLNGSLDHLAKSDTFHEAPGVTWVLDSNLCAFRARESIVLSPFLASWLSLPATLDHLRHRLAVRTSGGQWLLKSSTLAAIELPVPPMSEQQRFAEYVLAFESVRAKLQASLRDAETTFNVLLQQAFTGELTADWEARNADWIAERQAFYERLPQLVLLAFLLEKAQQARKASVLITALMKYTFLLQMEGSTRRRLYSFVPYHYGPFAQEVYSDLEKLLQQGLVTIEEDDQKTRINLTAPNKAEQVLQELPEELRQDVAAIVETYGSLDHEGLLKVVYERYPAYAKKSRRRRTPTKPTE